MLEWKTDVFSGPKDMEYRRVFRAENLAADSNFCMSKSHLCACYGTAGASRGLEYEAAKTR